MLKRKSAKIQLLLGLIPYTKRNTKLVLHPKQFFYELEKKTGVNPATAKSAFYRAQKTGLISYVDGRVKVSKEGTRFIKPFHSKKLSGDIKLLVMFDIPESLKAKRHLFRRYLKDLSFVQVQKSIWQSDLDVNEHICELIDDLGIARFVKIYQGVCKYPPS
jgi:DNA-binding transcriptional regulator PaaX